MEEATEKANHETLLRESEEKRRLEAVEREQNT